MMNEYLNTLISQLEELISELIIGDCKITISDNGILIEIDDVKQMIRQLKSNLDKLEDCLFVEIAEDIEAEFPLKEFSDLLEKESFTKEEREEIKNKIKIVNDIAKEHIVDTIKSLEDTLEKWD